MIITSDMVKRREIMPHLIENNVWVVPALRTNCLTDREHYDSLKPADRESVYPNWGNRAEESDE